MSNIYICSSLRIQQRKLLLESPNILMTILIFQGICHFLYGFDEWKRITKLSVILEVTIYCYSTWHWFKIMLKLVFDLQVKRVKNFGRRAHFICVKIKSVAINVTVLQNSTLLGLLFLVFFYSVQHVFSLRILFNDNISFDYDNINRGSSYPYKITFHFPRSRTKYWLKFESFLLWFGFVVSTFHFLYECWLNSFD